MTPTNLKLYKWLKLFGPLTYWQDQIRQCPWRYPVVLFIAKPQVMTTLSLNHYRVVFGDFQTLILCGHENLPVYDIPQVLHDLRVRLCLANSIDPA